MELGFSMTTAAHTGTISLLLSCMLSLGCSTEPDSNLSGVGMVTLALSAQLAGKSYRLRNAEIVLTGPISVVVSSEDEPFAEMITVTLPEGSYQVLLRDGWILERLDGMHSTPLEAELASANPTQIDVLADQSKTVVFSITTNGAALTTGLGTLQLAAEVTIDAGSARTWTKQAVIRPSNLASAFGQSLAIAADGRTLAIGATQDSSAARGVNSLSPGQGDISAPNAGAAFVFERVGSDWSQVAYVKSSNASHDDRFGISIAISRDGNTLAVGATGESSGYGRPSLKPSDDSAADAGAAYVFTRSANGLSEQAYLKASLPLAGAAFGCSLQLSAGGDLLVAGASGESESGSAAASGAAYVFTRTDRAWTQAVRLQANYPQAAGLFGARVALSGDENTLAVSEPGNSGSLEGEVLDAMRNSGAVHVFVRDGDQWRSQAFIKASRAEPLAEFGSNVVLSSDGKMLFVASWKAMTFAGEVESFERVGEVWSSTGLVRSSDETARRAFGLSLALSPEDSQLLIGAPMGGFVPPSSPPFPAQMPKAAGTVHLFQRNATGWSELLHLQAPVLQIGSSFGASLAIASDRTLVVSAIGERPHTRGINSSVSNVGDNNTGTVYVFH